MKLKTTNIFMIIATISCSIAFLINILTYYGLQSLCLKIFGAPNINVHVTNIYSTVFVALMLVVYVAACIVTVRSDKMRTGWTACLIALISAIVLFIVIVISDISAQNMASATQGVTYLAAHAALNGCRQYTEKPFIILALVFLSISFGTLFEKDNK